MRIHKITEWTALLLGNILLFWVGMGSAEAKVDVMGYFNMDYKHTDLSDVSTGSFNQKDVNIILQQEMGMFKFFSEIEFEDSPTIEDAGTGNGAVGQGTITLERGYAELSFHKMVKLSVGRMLQPTLWQTNHYPNLIMSLTKPQLVQNIFKKDFIGLQFNGRLYAGMNYRVWISRGEPSMDTSGTHPVRGPTPPGVSVGTRLGYDFNFPGGYAYLGLLGAHYSDATPTNPLGAEIDFYFNRFTLWSEYSAKSGVKGYYGTLSYGIPIGTEGTVSPYFLLDHLKRDTDADAKNRYAFGLNYKPKAEIVTKIELLITAAANGADASTGVGVGFVYFYN